MPSLGLNSALNWKTPFVRTLKFHTNLPTLKMEGKWFLNLKERLWSKSHSDDMLPWLGKRPSKSRRWANVELVDLEVLSIASITSGELNSSEVGIRTPWV